MDETDISEVGRAAGSAPADALWVHQVLDARIDPAWSLEDSGYDHTREAGIEARFSIGNGLIGVRGARSVSRGPTWPSYQQNLTWAAWPRTYVAGLFDTPDTEPPVPALVPGPDWLRLRIWIDGALLLLRSGQTLTHRRTLDLRRGALLTHWSQRQPGGQVVHVGSMRFVSIADRALGGQLLQLAVEGTPAALRLEASFEVVGSALDAVHAERGMIVWRTLQTERSLAVAAWPELSRADDVTIQPFMPEPMRWIWNLSALPGETITFTRLVAFARGDFAGADVHQAATDALCRGRSLGWRAVLGAHEGAWSDRWAACDLRIEGDAAAQRAMRFALYHLISAVNPGDERVSVGARALTGDSYLGHVFWDTEIYLLPFYTLTWPAAARALLMYRWRTLSGARAKALRMGYRGAFYAWESADTGEETTPEKVIDPNGRVIEVLCGRQEWHISADIAYAVWRYWQATGDDSFMLAAGAEILLETARFWASCAQLEADGRYHIRGVIGPDEYHEHIDDSAFTNVMARWTIERGLETAQWLEGQLPADAPAGNGSEPLTAQLGVDDAELAHWRDVAQRMTVHYDPQTRLFEQFEGYFGLEDIDVSAYDGRTVPMDVVLGRERTQGSQVVKQADVVALLAMLPDAFDLPTQAANYRYYAPRCGHGSSLSRALHAVVAARLGLLGEAMEHFGATAATDLGEATVASAGGVRIAAQGGLWQAAVFGFAGLAYDAQQVSLCPQLPDGWRSLAFTICWRGRSIELRIEPEAVTAVLVAGAPMPFAVHAERAMLALGEEHRFAVPVVTREHGAAPAHVAG